MVSRLIFEGHEDTANDEVSPFHARVPPFCGLSTKDNFSFEFFNAKAPEEAEDEEAADEDKDDALLNFVSHSANTYT